MENDESKRKPDRNQIVFESVEQCHEILGIPRDILLSAKKAKLFDYHRVQINRRFFDYLFSVLTGEKLDDVLDARKEKALLTREERKAAERENRLADGEILTVDQASEIYLAKMNQVVARLDAQASRLDAQLANTSNPVDCRKLIEDYNEETKRIARETHGEMKTNDTANPTA